MKKLDPRILLRNLLIEIIIYSILIFGYYWLVLRWLDDWLLNIFRSNLTLYGFVGLGLILVQAVFLNFITSFLMKYFKLDQFGVRRFLDVFSNR
jgi:multisubunit Na+/H+ antiporter MnhB subunit